MNIKWNEWSNKTSVTDSLSELVGETLLSVDGLEKNSFEVVFITQSGKALMLYHEQGCCESVDLEDFESDCGDFIGAKVLSFEEVSSEQKNNEYGDSDTWTFYKMETDKGGLFMRWHGSSNGYYSESVDIKGGVVLQ